MSPNKKINKIRVEVEKIRARLWLSASRAWQLVVGWRLRHGNWILLAALTALISLSIFFADPLQINLEGYYSTETAIDRLRALILAVGSAMIGASAIVTSLVLFAMQVNIERMPHGLFRRLSADRKLLGAFALAFLIAIGITVLSTLTDSNRLAYIVLAASWSTLLILVLFMYAYQRALTLINPLQQLNILVFDTRKDLNIWVQRAKRAAPLFDQIKSLEAPESSIDSKHDVARDQFFCINKHWTSVARRAVAHAISFAQRYADQGDYEVSKAALSSIVHINLLYTEAKGKTFFANNPFMEDPRASDNFINETLELLRQNIHVAVANRDEQKIEQTMRAMADLVKVYSNIDYSNPHAKKTHAHLAAGYLADAVQNVLPTGMVDVLMEGARLLGHSANLILVRDGPDDITTITQKLSQLALASCGNQALHPVVIDCIKQLSNITFNLLSIKSHDIHFAINEVQRHVTMIAKLFVRSPEPPLSQSHSMHLAPYYSSTGLLFKLTVLANELAKSEPDDENVQFFIRNIAEWSDGLYESQRELLLQSIETQSNFTIDMIHWITGVTEALLLTSNSPACSDYHREKLAKNAIWLVSTFSWIPETEKTTTFVENYQLTEALFEVASNAFSLGCDEVANDVFDQLVLWTFKAGMYQTGWNVFEKGLCGLAALSFFQEWGKAKLRSALKAQLQSKTVPSPEIRERTARRLMERASNLNQRGHWVSQIEMAFAKGDPDALREALKDIVEILESDLK